MNITDVNKNSHRHRPRRRRGRGAAAGRGKTCGRGQKGLGSRSGANRLKGFVGGQTTLMIRLPKRGFNNAIFRKQYVPVDIGLLEAKCKDGDEVTPEHLVAQGVHLNRNERIKILGSGQLSKKLHIKAHAFSKRARETIESAGGTAEVIS